MLQRFETHCESVKLAWEERFEASYGFWQGCWDEAVARVLAHIPPPPGVPRQPSQAL